MDWDFTYAWGEGVVAGNDSYGWGKLVSAVANNLMLAEAVSYRGLGGSSDLLGYLVELNRSPTAISLAGW